jgi:hypothetical protein
MTNKEIYALLVVEYMKSILGKNRYLDNKLLFSKRQLDSSYIMP